MILLTFQFTFFKTCIRKKSESSQDTLGPRLGLLTLHKPSQFILPFAPSLKPPLLDPGELLKGTCSLTTSSWLRHTSYLHPCYSRMVPSSAVPRSL